MSRLLPLVLIIGLFIVYLSWPNNYEKRVALVLGNSDYAHSPRINSSANNARDISQSLRRLGFDVIEGTDLTQYATRSILAEFDKQLKDADIALLYYSGYVHQEGDQTYIRPVEANPLKLYELGLQTIELRSMLIQMERSAKASLVVLDACRAFLSFQFQNALNKKCYPLAKIPIRQQMMFSYSAKSPVSLSTMQSKNSPFAKSLLRFADRELKTGEKVSLFAALSAIQKEVAFNTDSKQVPWSDFSSIKDVSIELAHSKPFADTKFKSSRTIPIKRKENQTANNRSGESSSTSIADRDIIKLQDEMPKTELGQTKVSAIGPEDQIADRPKVKVLSKKKRKFRKTVARESWQEQKLRQMLNQND